MSARGRSVFLLPDRVLVLGGRSYAEIAWSDLSVEHHQSRFIEDGPVPKDAPVVDATWKYVNVGGGPDRRYKNNRQLPIMGYGEVVLTSPSGLRVEWEISNPSAATAFGSELAAMAKAALPPPAGD